LFFFFRVPAKHAADRKEYIERDQGSATEPSLRERRQYQWIQVTAGAAEQVYARHIPEAAAILKEHAHHYFAPPAAEVDSAGVAAMAPVVPSSDPWAAVRALREASGAAMEDDAGAATSPPSPPRPPLVVVVVAKDERKKVGEGEEGEVVVVVVMMMVGTEGSLPVVVVVEESKVLLQWVFRWWNFMAATRLTSGGRGRRWVGI
jgi:hypothetical protein